MKILDVREISKIPITFLSFVKEISNLSTKIETLDHLKEQNNNNKKHLNKNVNFFKTKNYYTFSKRL